MKKIQDYSLRSPMRFSLGFTLFFVLFSQAFGRLTGLLPDNTFFKIADELLFIAWPAALVVLCGCGFIYRQKGFFATLGAGLPILLLYGTFLLIRIGEISADPQLEWGSASQMVLGAVMLIGVGFREEVLFRGVVLNVIARKSAAGKKGIWFSVLTASALFGAIHMSNILYGVSLESALVQSIMAFSTGAYYCAIYLRGGNIWAMALLHTVFDAAGTVDVLFATGGTVATVINELSLGALFLAPVGLLMAAFLLRKSKQQKILDRLEQLRSQVKNRTDSL